MRRLKYFSSFAGVLLVVCFATSAAANGRSVGVRATDVAVDAVIEDYSGTKHSWSRVKIGIANTYQKTLDTRTGEATSKVPLSKIAKLSFLDNKANADGYSKAKMVLTGSSENTYEVKVVDKGQPVKLVGYAMGASSEIDLLRCKEIEFFTMMQERGQPTSAPPPMQAK